VRRLVALALPLVVLVAGCGGDNEEPLPTGASVPGFAFAGGAVADGKAIDPRYTCDGDDVSPALAWEGVPADTAELVLVLDDPDAPGGTFTHWLAYGLEPGTTGLPEAVPVGGEVSGPPAMRQGANDFGKDGYGGPCPPGGQTHGYVFTLYALDRETGLDAGASLGELRAALEGHVLTQAVLTASYSRS
jgi:Raf kinase inhibitor-like YbhB/YbcL family protein